MTNIRVGTRGSELARTQTRWVCDRLRESLPSISIEEVIIKTHGDLSPTENFGPAWPVGAFVGALESALIERRIDLAVHSYKDMQTATTDGLVVAATPAREVPHDVLLTRSAWDLSNPPKGARIGTCSPRRAAQIKRLGEFEIVPIRGNVPTRVKKLHEDNLDGIILAAAGLKRLGLDWPYTVDLPIEDFLPAPGQGALAVQVRERSAAADIAAAINDPTTNKTVKAERSFLAGIGAGCHTPVGAFATITGKAISLCARLFTDDYRHNVEGIETGEDPTAVGLQLATELRSRLGELA